MKISDVEIRDPFIYTECGRYYLIGTTGVDPWGQGSDFSLYVSKDMQTFEFVKTLVSPEILAGYTQFWAPELHFYKGKYYIIVSVFSKENGRGSIILCSDKVDGNYTFLTGKYITPEDWTCLDATLFIYNDKPYLCFSNEWVETINHDGDGSLFMAELAEDLTRLVSNPVKIVSGRNSGIAIEKLKPDQSGTGWVAEGPYLLNEKGKIVLYWSTYTDNGYCILKSFADDVYGPYKFDSYVYINDGGHSMVFTDNFGKKKIIFHQPNVTPFERPICLDLE